MTLKEFEKRNAQKLRRWYYVEDLLNTKSMDIKQQQDTAERIEFTISNLQHQLQKLQAIEGKQSINLIDARTNLLDAIDSLKKEIK